MKWWLRFTISLLFGITSLSGEAEAQQSCKVFNLGYERQFNCSDGTIKKISIMNEQLVVRTFNPESKAWNESRFPIVAGMTLDSINISVMLNAD